MKQLAEYSDGHHRGRFWSVAEASHESTRWAVTNSRRRINQVRTPRVPRSAYARSQTTKQMVGATGFEPATTTPPAWCATRLRYAPIGKLWQQQMLLDRRAGCFPLQARSMCSKLSSSAIIWRISKRVWVTSSLASTPSRRCLAPPMVNPWS